MKTILLLIAITLMTSCLEQAEPTPKYETTQDVKGISNNLVVITTEIVYYPKYVKGNWINTGDIIFQSIDTVQNSVDIVFVKRELDRDAARYIEMYDSVILGNPTKLEKFMTQ